MKEFIASLFSDKDGNVSSKRLVMFILTALFILVCIVNLFTGKSINDALLADLFTLLTSMMALVFGENITGIFKKGNN